MSLEKNVRCLKLKHNMFFQQEAFYLAHNIFQWEIKRVIIQPDLWVNNPEKVH